MAPVVEDSQKSSSDNFQERRAQAIAAKAQEIEKVPVQLNPTQLNSVNSHLADFF